ncbi:MAG: molybdopterin-dependent oxidoreductase, partial [Frankiaceae bacterium]|nr:molybdopterin-dependent oxidoreductase [Arenimonas sp.]
LLAAISRALGTGNIDHRLAQLDHADAAVAEPFQMASAAMEKAAVVLLVGCNIRHELPLLHQRLLKAGKRGAKIFAINPVDFEFTFSLAGRCIVAPSRLAAAFAAVAASVGAGLPEGIEAQADASTQTIADALKSAGENAVIVLGEIAENHALASHFRAAARALAQATGASVNRIPQGANAVGLARLGLVPAGEGKHAAQMLAEPLKTYVLYGIEPEHDFAQAVHAKRACTDAAVVAFAAFASTQLKLIADVILPIALLPEMEATLTNLDGTEQTSAAGGKLPGEARPGWRVLRALGEALGISGFEFTDIAGLRAGPDAVVNKASQRLASSPGSRGEGLERIRTTPIYRADAVLRRAAALNAHPLTARARIVLHPDDALARGLAEGAMAKVSDGTGTAVLPVAVSSRVAAGAAWVESGYEATSPLSATGALVVTGA